MKTSERHRLKENELARLLGRLQVWLDVNRLAVGIAAGVVGLAVIGTAGILAWQAAVENRARGLLAEAMVTYEARVLPPPPPTSPDEPAMTAQMPGTFPSERARLEAALPRFLAAAEQYPGTSAGRMARFHAAAVLVALGRHDEAVTEYERLLAGRDVAARMARFGKAEAHVQAGRFEEAISVYRALVDSPDPEIPVEGVLMELARAYEMAGRVDEARTTLTTIVEQHADSPFAPGAREALDRLQSRAG
jgi:tetratricopeptide (TPR) repeat protein